MIQSGESEKKKTQLCSGTSQQVQHMMKNNFTLRGSYNFLHGLCLNVDLKDPLAGYVPTSWICL